jgi:hypothetical protein
MSSPETMADIRKAEQDIQAGKGSKCVTNKQMND